MAVKKKPTTKAVIKPRAEEETAAIFTRPSVQAALTIQQWPRIGSRDKWVY
jgi:hypothetical protein